MINKVLPAGEPANLSVVSWSLQLVDMSKIRLSDKEFN